MLNNRAPKYVKPRLTEMLGEIDNSITIVGDYNTPPSIMNRTTKQKTSKEIQDWNNSINPSNT